MIFATDTSIHSRKLLSFTMARQSLCFFCLIWLLSVCTVTGHDREGDTAKPVITNEPANAGNAPGQVGASTERKDFATGMYGGEISGSSHLVSSANNAMGDLEHSAGSASAHTTGKRILIVDCLLDGSHTHIQRLMARELASRGHNVTWLSTKLLMYWPTERDRELINFRLFETSMTEERRQKNLDFWTRKSLTGELSSFAWYAKMWLGQSKEVQVIFQSVKDIIRDFLYNTNFDELRAANFDLVLCEVMLPVCSVLAHDILKVPFINTINGGFLGTRYSRWFHLPSPLSYVPEFVTGYTDSMSFPQRVKNFLTHATSLLIYDYVLFAGVDRERASMGLDTRTGTKEIMARSELFIYNWDFHIEFPRPVTPNTILIGGLTIGPPNPLPSVFEDFIQGSDEHGVVVFSVSTLMHVMDMDMANTIASALARLPNRVIWKYLGEERPASLGNNTMTIPWIPQKDLMAHEKTRLLIYHGGLNGGYEAMYHGVPILGIPLFTDQVDDMVRLKYHVGMADYFPNGIRGLTSERLYQGIRGVLDDPSYRENAMRASRKLRDVQLAERNFQLAERNFPLARTARWIEYVMDHGSDHLRTKIETLTWYQYFLLDVGCIYLVTIIALLWLLKKMCCCGQFCNGTKQR